MVDSARRRRGPSRAFWAIAGVVLLVAAVTALLVLFGGRNASLTAASPATDPTAGRGNSPSAPAPSQPPANHVPPDQSAPGRAPAGPAPGQPGPVGAAPPGGTATGGAADSGGARSPQAAFGTRRPMPRAGHLPNIGIEHAHSLAGHDVSSRDGEDSHRRGDESGGDGDHRRQHISVGDSGLDDRSDGLLLSRLTNPLDLLGDLAHTW